jgi:membrane fusion protein, multidrug efflux system
MRASVIAIALPLLVASCNRSEAGPQTQTRAEEPPRALGSAAVEERAMPKELVLTGSLVANRQSDLAANAAGRVLATMVERGQKVAAGEVVARLDARMAKFSAKAASAQSRLAKQQLSLAGLECERADKLLASGSISRTEYDRTKSQCETGLESLSAAQSSAALAAVQAGDSVIRAPFAGIVGERFVDIGEYVQPSTRVVSLFSIDPIRVSIAVPEAEVAQIIQGQTVRFEISALGDRVFEAEVKYISPALRETTRDLLVEAIAPNKEGLLHPGMFATVRITTGERRLLAVPEAALVVTDGRALVWVVRDGRAVQQVVRTGPRVDGWVGVLAGLTTAERVVLDPPKDLVDGTRVE